MVCKKALNQRGFTLIEVLISIVLLSFLMVYVYRIINDSVNTKDTITQEDRELMGIERALDRIASDFTQIYSPLYFSPLQKVYKKNRDSDFDENNKVNQFPVNDLFPLLSHNGHPVPEFQSPAKSTFIFLSTANRRRLENTKEARFVWIRYKLVSDEKSRGGNTLVRNFEPFNIYGENFYFDDKKDEVILRNIKNLAFEYWDPVKKKWAGGLREIGNSKYSLALIKVDMEWIDANDEVYEYSRTFRQYWQPYDAYLDELVYKEEQEAKDKLKKQGGGK